MILQGFCEFLGRNAGRESELPYKRPKLVPSFTDHTDGVSDQLFVEVLAIVAWKRERLESARRVCLAKIKK